MTASKKLVKATQNAAYVRGQLADAIVALDEAAKAYDAIEAHEAEVARLAILRRDEANAERKSVSGLADRLNELLHGVSNG